ncbi:MULTISPECIES: hypothetical protein [Xenorhabdus]|uniref:hypothetical protein n=1 Tax=Xenorhabdus TaxID=626 RepID=UPI000A9560CC|nr:MULTISPECIES: hypothetical protein [Xenorhabdus]
MKQGYKRPASISRTNVDMAVVRRETVNGRKRKVSPPPEELTDVKYRLERAGFSPHNVG